MIFKKTLLTLVGVLCTLSVWATDYAVTVTRTLSNSDKTSTWSAIKANSGNEISGSNTATGDGLYFDCNTKKIKLEGEGDTKCNVKSGAIMYVEVPTSGCSGSITLSKGATDRYFQMPSTTKVSCNGSANFSSSDIVSLNGGYYIQLSSIADCKFGKIVVNITSGEKYTKMTKLAIPTITADNQGNVTLAAGTNMHYTTDGTDPVATSAAYSAPFKVEDGTVVKAISIGDGTTTTNSDIASKTILVAGITVATPVIKYANGVVGITCSTNAAKIQYSINGGEFKNYAHPFVIGGKATIQAKASRENCDDSSVASLNAEGISAKSGSKTVYLSYGAFDAPQIIDGFSTLVGKAGNDAEGWKFVLCGNNTKAYSSGNKIASGEKGDITSIKISNGAQNKLVIPKGVKVNRITIYSYVNNSSNSTVSYWKEIDGTNYQEADVLAMEAYTDVADYQKNPDVCIYAFNDKTGEITFNNAGYQLCFTMAVDYTTNGQQGPTYVTKQDLYKSTKTAPAAGSTFISNDMIEASTVFATKAFEVQEITIGGDKFNAYIQVRVDKAPTAENPSGTEKADCTPIIIKAKKSGDLTVYMRRQCVNNDCVAGDGKDVQLINQNGVAAVEGDLTISSFLDDKKEYAYCTETFSLKEGETYTLFARGTTLQLYGIMTSFKEEVYETTYLPVDNGKWPIDYIIKTENGFTTADAPGNRENGMFQFPEDEPSTDGNNAGDAATGINNAQVAGSQAVGIYSANGAKVAGLQKGINIVKLANGKTVKVIK